MNSTDADFIASIQSGRLPSLNHEQHLRVAWIVLQERSLLDSIRFLCRLYQGFATAKGKPELFHETITWAFVILVHQRMVDGHGGATWQQFIALNPDLNRGRASLARYYGDATLASERARSTFVFPDRCIR